MSEIRLESPEIGKRNTDGEVQENGLFSIILEESYVLAADYADERRSDLRSSA
jgi:hypothetical protein